LDLNTLVDLHCCLISGSRSILYQLFLVGKILNISESSKPEIVHICSAIANMHGKLLPIEIKLSATPRQEMAREITNFRNDYGE